MQCFIYCSSDTKYDSGSGWPSFYKTLEVSQSMESVERISDASHGMIRVEVVCRNVSINLKVKLSCLLFNLALNISV